MSGARRASVRVGHLRLTACEPTVTATPQRSVPEGALKDRQRASRCWLLIWDDRRVMARPLGAAALGARPGGP
jgi:hypothetical protein